MGEEVVAAKEFLKILSVPATIFPAASSIRSVAVTRARLDKVLTKDSLDKELTRKHLEKAAISLIPV